MIVSFKMSLFSLFIGNPTKYTQFKRGEIGNDYDSVYIEAGAHPNILAEVSHFANASNRMIRFRDVDYKRNIIILYPNEKKVRCNFQIGDQLTLGLPTDFEYYDIDFGWAGVACLDDIETILSWKNAKELKITDRCHIAYKLRQRIDELRQMKYLEVLHLRINAKNFENIELEAFFGNFTKLQRIEFDYCSVEERKFGEFEEMEKLWNIGEFERVQCRDGVAAYVRKGAIEKYRNFNYVIA